MNEPSPYLSIGLLEVEIAYLAATAKIPDARAARLGISLIPVDPNLNGTTLYSRVLDFIWK
jgi:hypothetical protein